MKLNLKKKIQQLLLKSVQFLELKCNQYPTFGRVYYSLFYKNMIKEEALKAGLKQGSSVLHVGSGPMPFTAIALAEAGYKVWAVDSDIDSYLLGSTVVDKMGLKDQIKILNHQGEDLDCQEFDGIWVSLHVCPKAAVLKSLYQKMKTGAKLVYRNPVGFLKLFYPEVKISNINNEVLTKSKARFFGKEIVMLVRTDQASACINLCNLQPGLSGVIQEVPTEPLLSPLGFRPGKKVLVEGFEAFGGPVIARIEGRKVALGRNLALGIKVNRC